MEDPVDPVSADDAEVVEVDDVVWERFEGCGLAESSVGPMAVVEGRVFGQDVVKVGEVPDEGAVQEFGADGSVPAFLDRVHHWCLDGGLHDFDAD